MKTREKHGRRGTGISLQEAPSTICGDKIFISSQDLKSLRIGGSTGAWIGVLLIRSLSAGGRRLMEKKLLCLTSVRSARRKGLSYEFTNGTAHMRLDLIKA